jgi:integrase
MNYPSVDDANDRLKQAGCRIRIAVRGDRWLNLRGHLPNKPGEPVGSKQRYIPLGFQLSATALQRAEREAHLLNHRLIERSFDWKDYGVVVECDRLSMPTGELVEIFREHYLRRGKIKPQTWKDTWHYTLQKLPSKSPLREGSILAVVLTSEPDSRNREQVCQRLQKLADFAGLDIDLSEYRGHYEPESRNIPSDELIVEWRDRIPNTQWQWVYGMMATFGLRPHEVFSCTFPNPDDPLTLHVFRQTKTGFRVTHAIHPEWAQKWNLTQIDAPPVAGIGKKAGQSVTKAFSKDRYGVPFGAYNLRHAFAIRASVTKGLPVSTAASLMGHSVVTHTKSYHRWLSASTNADVYRRIVLGKD